MATRRTISLRRWAVFAAPAAIALLLILRGGTRLERRIREIRDIRVTDLATAVPADGREHRVATLQRRPAWLPLHAEKIHANGDASGIRFEQEGKNVAVWLRAPVEAKTRRIAVQTEAGPLAIQVNALPDTLADAAGDGLPDWMPLHTDSDREAFRRWFTELAERQADAGAALPVEINDCASLLRFAYREALVRHDDKWYAQYPAEQMPALRSVAQWNYPHTPLGAGLFRTRAGEYLRTDDTDGRFAQFADARTLMEANTHRVSRDLRDARPGDLIFYRQLEQSSPYHSMILTGGRSEWAVYHTGPIGKGKGEMRRVLVADLLRHPDARWRPVAPNTNFLGVFRWNILRESP